MKSTDNQIDSVKFSNVEKLSNVQKNTSERLVAIDTEIIQDNTVIIVQSIRKLH